MAYAYQLEQTQWIAAPRRDVFDFFSTAENLERITPAFLRFRIRSPLPIEMKVGQLIEYRIALFGLPMKWLTEISVWEPNERFVDDQLEGPYRRWHHLHEFRDERGGTEMRDVVDYELPFGMLGRLAHATLVRSTLNRIFAYRRSAIEAAFPPPSSARAMAQAV